MTIIIEHHRYKQYQSSKVNYDADSIFKVETRVYSGMNIKTTVLDNTAM